MPVLAPTGQVYYCGVRGTVGGGGGPGGGSCACSGGLERPRLPYSLEKSWDFLVLLPHYSLNVALRV